MLVLLYRGFCFTNVCVAGLQAKGVKPARDVDSVQIAKAKEWMRRSNELDLEIFTINGEFVPSAVAKLGPGMADGSMKLLRDDLFAACVVGREVFPTIQEFLDPPDHATRKNLEKRLYLSRVQLQTWEQVFCDYEKLCLFRMLLMFSCVRFSRRFERKCALLSTKYSVNP